MECNRNGGCGPCESPSCNECPVSKPEYTQGVNNGAKKAVPHEKVPVHTFDPKTVVEGQTVFLEPLGNASRRWDGRLLLARITGVKRKYVYAARLWDNGMLSRNEIPFNLDNGRSKDDGNNTGYRIWVCQEAYDELVAYTTKKLEIEKFFNRFPNHAFNKDMTAEEIDTIYAIIKKYS